MPVLRDTQRAGAVRPGGVVRASGAEAQAQSFAALAAGAGQVAGQAARAMAQASEEEAVALATAAVFNVDANGVPQIPEDNALRMGTITRKAYDRTLQQRYRQRLSVSLEGKLNEARDRNQTDLAGFQAESEAIIAGFGGTVPDEYRGFYEDEAVRLSGDIASRIGWGQGQLDKRNAGADFAVMSSRTNERITSLALANDTGGALALIADLEATGAGLIATGAADAHDVERAVNAAKGRLAWGEMARRITREEWSGDQMAEAQEALRTGSSEELNAAFPDQDSRLWAATQLSILEGDANAKATAAAKAADLARDIRLIKSGAMEGTKKEQEIFDLALARDIGSDVPLDPGHWTAGYITDKQTWATIRKAGFLPLSLKQAFTQFENGGIKDPRQMQNVYQMWLELSEGRAPDGSPSDLGGKIPERAARALELTRLYTETTGDLTQGYQKARELLAQPFDREILFQRMAGFGERSVSGAGGILSFGSDGVLPKGTTADGYDGAVRAYLRDRLTDDIGETPSYDLRRATHLFEALVMGGADEDDAYGRVKTHMELRSPETSAIYTPSAGFARRSAFAPEKLYAHPDDPGVWGRTVKGRKSWFENWMAKEAFPGIAEETGIPLEDLEIGVNIGLAPITEDPSQPRYRVWIDTDGDRAFMERSLMIIDPAPAFALEKVRLGRLETLEIGAARDEDGRERKAAVNSGHTAEDLTFSGGLDRSFEGR